jgi:hypothetical protein
VNQHKGNRDAGSLCHHLSMWLNCSHKQREESMNTIQITNKESGNRVTYTESELTHILDNGVENAKEIIKLQDKIKYIKNYVRDFFSEGDWSDGEQTINKGDVNELLDAIGCSKLTTKYRASFTVTGNFKIEVEDEDEIESLITDNLQIECYSTSSIDVDDIEVTDIEEDE